MSGKGKQEAWGGLVGMAFMMWILVRIAPEPLNGVPLIVVLAGLGHGLLLVVGTLAHVARGAFGTAIGVLLTPMPVVVVSLWIQPLRLNLLLYVIAWAIPAGVAYSLSALRSSGA